MAGKKKQEALSPDERAAQIAEEAANFVEVSMETPHGEMLATFTPESFARTLRAIRPSESIIPSVPPSHPEDGE